MNCRVNARILQKHFDIAFNHRQRRAKFVRCDADEIGFGLVETFEGAVGTFKLAASADEVHH